MPATQTAAVTRTRPELNKHPHPPQRRISCSSRWVKRS